MAISPVKACLHFFLLAFPVLAISIAGCASGPVRHAKPSPPEPYMRVQRPDAETVQLQIAVRKFLPARGHGPVVWLAGASHIGETNYYASLQIHLNAQTLVLYEGVGEHPRKPRHRTGIKSPSVPTPATHAPADKTSGGASLQMTMARSLGLVFQLQAIDYERTNFCNSDLSVAQIQALMQPERKVVSGEASSAQPRQGDADDSSFQELLGAMDGSSVFGALANGIFQIIGSSTKLQAMTKLALIEVFGQIRGDMAQMQGLPPEMKRLFEVLIRERNKVVIADLKEELRHAARGDSLVVFYGAGHLVDMEKRLRHELRYLPVEEFWLPVFSVNTEKAGLSNFELSLLRSVLRSQLVPINGE